MAKQNEALEALIDYVGSSAADFARYAGVNHRHIYEYKSGGKPLGGRIALRIADAYGREMRECGISVEDLLRGRYRRRREAS